tara:strand:+ start:73 stop:288 length:216 start_codon:yes stop_codon:yes gene_type:complete
MLNKLTNNKQGESIMKNIISKIRKLIQENPVSNQNLSDSDLKEFLNSFENYNQAVNFVKSHNYLSGVKERS